MVLEVLGAVVVDVEAVVDVVLEVVVEEELVVVLVVDMVVELVELVVEDVEVVLDVVVGGGVLTARTVMRSLRMLRATKRPVSSAPAVSRISASGAQSNAPTVALRENRTASPATWTTISPGVGPPSSGPKRDPLSSSSEPATSTSAGPETITRACRDAFRLQKTYCPPLSRSVPGPWPPPLTSTAPYTPGGRSRVAP